jgi:hypothetical protein
MKTSKLTTSIPTVFGVCPVVAIHEDRWDASRDFMILRDSTGAVIHLDKCQAFHLARFIRSISGGRL